MEGDTKENIIIGEEHQNRDAKTEDLWYEVNKRNMHVFYEFRKRQQMQEIHKKRYINNAFWFCDDNTKR